MNEKHGAKTTSQTKIAFESGQQENSTISSAFVEGVPFLKAP